MAKTHYAIKGFAVPGRVFNRGEEFDLATSKLDREQIRLLEGQKRIALLANRDDDEDEPVKPTKKPAKLPGT